MSREIQKIHETILTYLLERREHDPGLYFTLRKTNRYDRLNKGFWFHGNDTYLAISFWTGTDWQNKTPNIFLRISYDGRTKLECTAKDSKEKQFYFGEELRAYVDDLKPNGQKFIKSYTRFKQDYLGSLESFLKGDKNAIDDSLRNMPSELKEVSDDKLNPITFITSDEFSKDIYKTELYRDDFKENRKTSPEVSLSGFSIKNISPIKHLLVNDIPIDSQWIFITGMNGMGKTSILRALTAAVCLNTNFGKPIYDFSDFEIQLTLHEKGVLKNYSIDSASKGAGFLTPGFAVYGPSRLQIAKDNKRTEKRSTTYSIFNCDAELLNFSLQLEDWLSGVTSGFYSDVDDRIKQIIELLPDLIPSLVRIEIPQFSNRKIKQTLFTEEDENGNHLEPVPFDQLASGIKSLVAMIGDMLLRLFAQQTKISDPSALEGIVLIDEIDIHLHPVLQKRLVELLSDTFPLIQFIATTHSPIPLLGAPKESVFLKVNRSKRNNISVDKYEFDIADLLPNTLLSSPIFGFEELINTNHDKSERLITEDDYEEAIFFKILDKKINSRIEELGLDND